MPVFPAPQLSFDELVGGQGVPLRLGALAQLFDTVTKPAHRALADARATVEVLHHLLERIGNLGCGGTRLVHCEPP